MGFSEALVKYEGSGAASIGQREEEEEAAMVNYGRSNESGKMLARELLARELQARELLAREMGSQTESQDRRRRATTLRSRSCNVSLDGSSIISRSRWEPEPAHASRRHETSSLPAEFLYFKFEQMVARWVQQKTLSAVLSLERFRPRFVIIRPPRTITTIANAKGAAPPALPSALSAVPSAEGTTNVPRFMRNTTTSASKTGLSPPPKAPDHQQQQQRTNTNSARARTPSKNNTFSSPARGRPSPLPVLNSRRDSSPHMNTRGTAPSRTRAPMLWTEPQLRKTQSATKKKAQAPTSSSTRQNDATRNTKLPLHLEETRSPLESTEQHDAHHYFKRDSADHHYGDPNIHIRYQDTSSTTETTLQMIPRPSKPDPEGPTPNSRPDPEGDCWLQSLSPLDSSSPQPNYQQLKISLPPTPRGTAPARAPSPTTKSSRVRSPSPNKTPTANGNVSPGKRGTKTPSPSKTKSSPSNSSTKKKSSPRKPQTPDHPKSSNAKRRKSRLPPLPSFRNSSPSPSPQQRTDDSPQRKGIPSPTGKPLSPRNRLNGNIAKTSQSRSITKPEPPGLTRYRRVHIRAAKVLIRFGRMLPHRRRFLRLQKSVTTLQSLLRRKLQIKAFHQAIKGTRLQKFACIVIQKNYRMTSCRSSYFQLRHAVILAQSAIRMFSCRSTYTELRSASKKLLGRSGIRERPSTPKPHAVTVKGGRLRIYAALLIQSLVRMRWVRAAFLELRASAVVLQTWFRRVHKVIKRQNDAAIVLQNWTQMLSWRACFLDLRGSVLLLQKWTRMVCARSRYVREKQNVSASLIQSFCRRDACKAAYQQLHAASRVLQQWVRARGVRIAYMRFVYAALVVQCWTRQRISERLVFELSRIVLIQATFRSYMTACSFSTKRVGASMMQACARGYLYRTRYLSLRLAAIVAQKRRRGKIARAYVGIRRSALWVETTKQKRSKMNDITDKPDPMDVDDMVLVTADQANNVAPLCAPQPGDTLKPIITYSSHNDGVVSAALAFVSQSPASKRSTTPGRSTSPGRSTTPRRSRRSPSPSSRDKVFFPRHAAEEAEGPIRAPSPRSHMQLKLIEGWSATSSSSLRVIDTELLKTSTDPRKRTEKKKRSGSRDPTGDNMSRKPPASSRHISPIARRDDLEPSTPPASYMSPPSPSRFPKQYSQNQNLSCLPFQYQQSARFLPPTQKQTFVQSLPSNFVPVPADMIARMSPVEMSPSQQPVYLISRSPGESSVESPQLYALQPLNEVHPPRQPQNPYLYLSSHQQPIREELGPRFGPVPNASLSDSILEDLERARMKKQESATKRASSDTTDFPTIPTIADNPSYYLPKAEVQGERKKEKDPTLAETDIYNVENSVEDGDNTPHVNPLKKVLQDRHSDKIVMPKLKREDDNTDRAIFEKLASIKQRSRSRKVQRLTSRTLKRNKVLPRVHTKEEEKRVDTKDEKQEEPKEKRAFVDVAVEQWAKQTLQKRKKSILTSVLDDESATQIQSVWRSRRDQLRLADLLLQTWSVTCNFSPDTLGFDRSIRQNAHILALDGAFRQAGYLWQVCNVLVKKSLIMVQWEGLVPIQFSKLGLPAEDTRCTVSVHCTGSESNLLHSWNEDRRCTLLVKAAIAKQSRRSSPFDRSLTRKSTDAPSTGDHISTNQQLVAGCPPKNSGHVSDSPGVDDGYQGSAIVIQNAFRRCKSNKQDKDDSSTFLGVPGDFQERMRVHSAVSIQSWWRMCVCRRMYRGLRRIQSRALLRVDKGDSTTSKFYNRLEKHTCETIVEEKEGFECTTGSGSSAEEEE